MDELTPEEIAFLLQVLPSASFPAPPTFAQAAETLVTVKSIYTKLERRLQAMRAPQETEVHDV